MTFPAGKAVRYLIFIILANLFSCTRADQEDHAWLGWGELPALPDASGFAGAFAGVSNDVLILAGGANFPDGRPWEGHPKIWHDRIFVLADPDGQWQLADTRLPRPLAYGVSISWNDRLLCFGGGDGEQHHANAFALRWTGKGIEIDELPSMPQAAAFFCGARVENEIFLAGGLRDPDASEATHSFWSLDLQQQSPQWKSLPPWPGPPRHLSVAGVQGKAFFLFSGIELRDGQRVKPYLTDGYRFSKGSWQPIASLPRPVAAAPDPAVALGSSHLLVLGGDGGTHSAALEDAHPGFDPGILAYHAITDTWIESGSLPKVPGPDPAQTPNGGHWPPVTTPVVTWRGRIVVPSGEVRPGVRTPRVPFARTIEPPSPFGSLDYTVLTAYLLCLLLMGCYFARREKGTNDFFLGGQRIPAWAAGISIFGTQLSAITFMAVPAKTYATDWVYFVMGLGLIAMAPVVVLIYLPFFRRLDITTAYEYLEHRFHLSVRLLGSASFIAFQLGRMAIVVFLPALALAAVTGMSVEVCIVVMGLLCTIYTVLGGIEAVIWTDVIQVFVLLGGAIISLLVVMANVDGGATGVWNIAMDADKLKLAQLSWDWSGPALGVILLGGIFNNLTPYTTDQAVVQRYLTTPDEKSAAQAIWTGALLSLPATLIFFAMGTALFAFYKEHPAALNPLGKTDQIFAWFIVTELPPGVSGLLIAGVFAAAMSSLDSSMNSVATAITTDFYRRFHPQAPDSFCLRLARWLTVILGLLATGIGLLMAQIEIKSLWDQFLELIGLLGGTLCGLFMLGIFTRRAHTTGALVGALASLGVLTWVKLGTNINGLTYAAIGAISCLTIGWAVSLVIPGTARTVTLNDPA